MVTKPRTNTRTRKTQEVAHIYDTFIVGAGISGLAAAIKLNEAGLTNFKIIEKASRVGGTWRENTYPGCGCDVPSALYSYSFAPSAKWSHLFARQPEILSYLEDVSREFDIESLIEFNTELLKAEWDNVKNGHCCKVSDEAAFCLIQRPYISKTLLT
ncbi:NAD(P)-binding protein, partial [Acinetobacter baumannii]|uniref:NAD(P)-binding protein n=2 Tax=Acinetobacter baumannii TaxID=470 RepID=UPI001D185664